MRQPRAIFFIISLLFLSALASGCPLDKRVEIVLRTGGLTAEDHARLGAIYEREGNLERAAGEYLDAIKKDPENLVALTGLGNVLLMQGKPRSAAVYYQRALAEDPENYVVVNNLALAWLDAGMPRKALEGAERAVEISGAGDPRALDTRAQARLATGDRRGAIEDLDAALELCEEAQGDALMEDACYEIAGRRDDLG